MRLHIWLFLKYNQNGFYSLRWSLLKLWHERYWAISIPSRNARSIIVTICGEIYFFIIYLFFYFIPSVISSVAPPPFLLCEYPLLIFHLPLTLHLHSSLLLAWSLSPTPFLPQGYLPSHTGSPHSSLSFHIFISMSKCHPFIFLQMNRLCFWKRTKENMSRTQFLLVCEFSCKQWWNYINSPLYNQKNEINK